MIERVLCRKNSNRILPRKLKNTRFLRNVHRHDESMFLVRIFSIPTFPPTFVSLEHVCRVQHRNNTNWLDQSLHNILNHVFKSRDILLLWITCEYDKTLLKILIRIRIKITITIIINITITIRNATRKNKCSNNAKTRRFCHQMGRYTYAREYESKSRVVSSY